MAYIMIVNKTCIYSEFTIKTNWIGRISNVLLPSQAYKITTEALKAMF